MPSAQLASLALIAATNAGVPPDIFNSLVTQESGWNAYAVGNAGEIGLSQLKPGTANDLGVNAYDPAQNLVGGANYLSQMYQKMGNWYDALRGYNAGYSGAMQNPNAGSSYAAAILSRAGYDPSASPADQATAGIPQSFADKLSTSLSGLSPVSQLKQWGNEMLDWIKSKSAILLMALIVIVLAWFGLQASLKA